MTAQIVGVPGITPNLLHSRFPGHGLNFNIMRFVRQPDRSVLDSALELHIAPVHLFQDVRFCYLQVYHRKIVEPGKLVLHLVPPYTGTALLVGIDNDLVGPATGFTNPLVIGLSQVYPEFYLAAEVFFPDIRLIVRADPPGVTQRLGCIECERQDSEHHSFIGFRWMLGDGQGMRLIIIPVQIGYLEFSFADRRL